MSQPKEAPAFGRGEHVTKILFLAALIPITAYVVGHVREQIGATIFAGIMVLPLLGIIYLLILFGRWHRGFHARMVRGGIRGKVE